MTVLRLGRLDTCDCGNPTAEIKMVYVCSASYLAKPQPYKMQLCVDCAKLERQQARDCGATKNGSGGMRRHQ